MEKFVFSALWGRPPPMSPINPTTISHSSFLADDGIYIKFHNLAKSSGTYTVTCLEDYVTCKDACITQFPSDHFLRRVCETEVERHFEKSFL